MNLFERYKDIVDHYPQFVTRNQFCEITGICKSAVYKLTKSKQIKYEKQNRRLLHYYDISIEEALQYKFNREFSSIVRQEYGSTIKRYYEIKLNNAPDALNPKHIQEITGYTRKTIERWLLNKEIQSIIVRCKYYVAKEDLLDFLVSERYLSIQKKSAQHLMDIEAIKKTILSS